jgi:SAM-dependent methyltransferase
LCDDVARFPDGVFGCGPGTQAFTGLARARFARRSVLDVGCGAGAAVLWLAAIAGQVVASDVNPRALEFVRLNAATNGVSNIRIVQGDLYDSVDGERFDTVFLQLPFVPAAPGSLAALYRDGGCTGSEVVQRAIAGLPRHMAPGGRAIAVFEHLDRGVGDAPAGSAIIWPDELQTLIVAGAAVQPDAYCLRNASTELSHDVQDFDAAASGLRTHLAALGVESIRSCIAVLCAEAPGWTDTIYAGDPLWEEVIPDTLERLVEGRRLALSGDQPIAERIQIPNGSFALHQEGNGVYCVLPPGYLFHTLAFTQEEWEQIQAWRQRGEPVQFELATKLASKGMIHV